MSMGMRALMAVAGGLLALALPGPGAAEEASAEIHEVSSEGIGAPVGTAQLSDSDHGLRLAVEVSGLTPGEHGFHLHEHGSCEPAANAEGQMVAALAAGGHYDPDGTGRHAGPEGEGHLGDLPALEADADGRAAVELIAPRLTVADARGRALVIHAGGDNYSDEPAPLGGGGARVACGVVQ
jgi:superoxide dismutase, Cu-Zn family